MSTPSERRERFLKEVWSKFDPSTGEHITSGDEILSFLEEEVERAVKEEREKIIEGWKEPNRQAYERGRQEERAKMVEEMTKKVILNSRAAIHYPKGEGVISVKELLDTLEGLQVKE